MKTPLFMRESAHLQRTVRYGSLIDWLTGWLANLVWPLGAALSLLALLATLQWLDERDTTRHAEASRQRAADLARAYQQGRDQGHAEMIATAEAGWAAARIEADRKGRGQR